MQKNSSEFSTKDAMELAKSPAGQQLINLLKNTDSAALQKAMREAASGNFEKAKESLTPFLEKEETQAILKKLGEKRHE